MKLLSGNTTCSKVWMTLRLSCVELPFFPEPECGFHQIPLIEDNKKLTPFITPFGRYCYTLLPFGITSAPEIFQRRMSEVLAGQEGVDAIIDDALIYGKTISEHDLRLKETLVYKLRRVKGEANFISSGSKIVKGLRRRQYDPAIIDRTIGLVLGPFTALYRSFLKRCTLTCKEVGTI